MADVLIKTREIWPQKHKGGRCEGGRSCRSAAVSQGMPEGPKAGRGKDDPHPEALVGAQPCLHLDFRLRGSKTTEEQCLLFKSPRLRYSITVVLENDTHP